MAIYRERGYDPRVRTQGQSSKEGISGKARRAGKMDSRTQQKFQQFKQQRGLA